MKLVVLALLLGFAATVALVPRRRLELIAALQRKNVRATQGVALVTFGYAVPIYLLLLVVSCGS
jgi:hypothetical protein